MPPDSNETELGNSNQGASPSAGKNTRVLLAPCCTWKCAPTAISSGVKDIAEVKMCFDFFINNISTRIVQTMSSSISLDQIMCGKPNVTVVM